MVNTPRNTIADDRNAVFKIQKAGLIDYSYFERTIGKIKVQEDIVITMGYRAFL